MVDPISPRNDSIPVMHAAVKERPDQTKECVTAVEPRVAAAAAGDRRAAEALLTELLPRIRNLVRYLIRGDGEVDDIAQEALVAVFRGLSSYRGDGRFESWVDRIVARTTFANLRKRRRDPAAPSYTPDLVLVAEGTDEYLSRREAVRLLDRLPNEQRHVLVLHHVLGMTVPEISVELEAPAETVRSRLRLAKKKLRELHDQKTGMAKEVV